MGRTKSKCGWSYGGTSDHAPPLPAMPISPAQGGVCDTLWLPFSLVLHHQAASQRDWNSLRRRLKTGDSTLSSPLASDDSQALPQNGETDRGQDSWKGHDEGSDSKGAPKVKMERVWLRGAAERLWWKRAMRAGVMWMLYGEGVIRKEWWNGCDEKGWDRERCGWSYGGIMVWWRKCDQKGTMEWVLWKKIEKMRRKGLMCDKREQQRVW